MSGNCFWHKTSKNESMGTFLTSNLLVWLRVFSLCALNISKEKYDFIKFNMQAYLTIVNMALTFHNDTIIWFKIVGSTRNYLSFFLERLRHDQGIQKLYSTTRSEDFYALQNKIGLQMDEILNLSRLKDMISLLPLQAYFKLIKGRIRSYY